MAVGFPLKTTYANGDVYSASDVNDTNGTVNLLATNTPYGAGKNRIINGGFDIWQRGTSFASVSGYFADRWTNSATYSNITSSRQSSGAPIGSQYYARHTSTGASSYISTYSYLESATVAPLLGQTVTFTLKLRRNATMTANINVRLAKSSTTDAGSGASWTDISVNTITNASLPTGTGSSDWYTSTITAAVPNDGTANSLRISTDYAAAVASGSILDIAQAQLEVGSLATSFACANGTIQGELASCQRYYYRQTVSTNYGYLAFGMCNNSTSAKIQIPLPVPLRVKPTSLDSPTASTLRVTDGTTGTTLNGTPTLDSDTSNSSITFNVGVASGLTQYRAIWFGANNSSSAYIGFSAEL